MPMSRRLSVRSFVLMLVTALNCGASAADHPKVLLIGIDGLRSDALQKATTPNLDALIANGIVDFETSVISTDVPKSDTVSGPGWTTFLTGTWADQHGVVDNSFDGRDREAAPHCFRLIKAVQPKLRTASLVNWIPINEFITTDADISVGVFAPASASDADKKDYAAADSRVAAMAADVLANDPADIVFAYFGAVDETGHAHGFHPSVPAYVAQIEVVDGHVGRLTGAIHSRKSHASEDWLIVVSTDHGGEGFGHGGGRENPIVRTAPMLVSGNAAAKGRHRNRSTATVDVVAVALTHLGITGEPTKHLAGSAEGWLQPPPTQPRGTRARHRKSDADGEP